MNEYIVRVEVVLHVQGENKQKAIDYAVDKVCDDLSTCFDDNDIIHIVDAIADVENCTLIEVEEEEE